MTGNLAFTSGKSFYINGSGGGRVPHPAGATYFTTVNAHTGAVKIKLPTASKGLSDMISFEVMIYDYTLNESFKLLITAYQYSSANWNNQSVVILTGNPNRDYTVRFGSDSTSHCVWIGETSSTWSHPQVTVNNFQCGYSAAASNYVDGWAVTFVTSFDTVEDTITTNLPIPQIVNDSINSQHYAAGSIDREHLAADIIDGTKIANDVINSEHYAAGSIDNEHIADNAINSEHYVAGSVDREHLANDIIDGTKIADDVINSEHYVAGSVDREHLANDIIDGTKIADDVINSEHYVAGSIDREHLANDIIDSTKIADDAINSEHYVSNSIDALHLNVSGNGSTSQFLRSDGDGTFTWATPTDTNTTYSVGAWWT